MGPVRLQTEPNRTEPNRTEIGSVWTFQKIGRLGSVRFEENETEYIFNINVISQNYLQLQLMIVWGHIFPSVLVFMFSPFIYETDLIWVVCNIIYV